MKNVVLRKSKGCPSVPENGKDICLHTTQRCFVRRLSQETAERQPQRFIAQQRWQQRQLLVSFAQHQQQRQRLQPVFQQQQLQHEQQQPLLWAIGSWVHRIFWKRFNNTFQAK